MIKKYSLWGLAGLALVLSLVVVTRPPQVVERVEVVKEQPIGSVVGPTSTFEVESHNGLTERFFGQPFVQTTGASSTVCSLFIPARASSTIVKIGMSVSALTRNAGAYQGELLIQATDPDATNGTSTTLARLDHMTSGGTLIGSTTLITGRFKDNILSSTTIKWALGNTTSATGTCFGLFVDAFPI